MTRARGTGPFGCDRGQSGSPIQTGVVEIGDGEMEGIGCVGEQALGLEGSAGQDHGPAKQTFFLFRMKAAF